MKVKSILPWISLIQIFVLLSAGGFRVGETKNINDQMDQTSLGIDEIENFVKAEVLRLWESIDLRIMAPFDLDSLIAAVEENESDGKGKYQYAYKIPIVLSARNAGHWYSIPDVGDIWCLRIKSAGALLLEFKFSKFTLPPGVLVWAFDDSARVLEGPLDFHNNQGHGRYVLSISHGEEAAIVYFQPKDFIEPHELEISDVFHGFRNPFILGHGGQLDSGNIPDKDVLPCEENVYCTDYSPHSEIINNDVRAVMLITIEGYGCTATFLNNKQDDLEAIILTARHCIHDGKIGQGPLLDLTSIRYYFNYNRPDCIETEPFDRSRYRHPTQGASLIAESNTFAGADQALLRISKLPPPHFKVYHAGWTGNLITPAASWHLYGIHHPRRTIKRMSRSLGLITTSLSGKYEIFWTNGVTEPGSSGSPLFRENGRVIGALSGGLSGCVITGPDFYGKFYKFYYAHQPVRIALGGDLVDFTNNGREILCYEGDLELEGNYYPAGDYQPENHIDLKAEKNIIAASPGQLKIFNEADFTFTAGNKIFLKPGFKVEAGAIFKARIQACTPGPQ